MQKVKHIIRDLLIFIFSVSGLSYLYRKRMQKKGPLVRVLCFHDVAEEEWFEAVMKMLSGRYNLITPYQFWQEDFAEDKTNILLTFDDGYQSWVDVVLPILGKYHAKGIFFINSGLLDAKDEGFESANKFVRDRLRLHRPRLVLTWEGAKELRDAGHTIGGHTHTHANLAKLDAAKAREEVLENKKRLEDELHVELIDFAYPFGRSRHMSPTATDMIKDNGYKNVYSAITGFASTNQSQREIPRTVVERYQPISSLKRWIDGAYDIFNKFRN